MVSQPPQHLAPATAEPARGRRRAIAALGAVLILVGGGLGFAVTRDEDAPKIASGTSSPPATVGSTATTAPPRREASIAFGGDVLIHSPVWEAADTGDGYDFAPMLSPIAARLTAADLAICHLEVTLAGPEDALSSFPRFRVPPELAQGLKSAGFDGCSVASNHALDFGEPGVVATLDALDAAGLAHAGTARSPEEGAQPARYDAGGIAVAQLSYAYGFNGFVPPAGKDWLVDRIDPRVILADARAARAAGAEFVVVSMHWGNEYTHGVVEAQQSVADALAEVPGAVDLIVGHHAHVVQPISKVGEMWVVWGMGNLLSGNAPQCCLAEATDGVVVTVTIGDQAGGVGVTGIVFTPTWNERDAFRVLPAADALDGTVDPDLAADLRASYERTAGTILSMGAAELGVEADKPLPPE